MKIIEQSIGCIPAGIKLVSTKDAAGSATSVATNLYQDLFKGLAKFSIPLLEWLPLWCLRVPTTVDLGTLAGWPQVLDQGPLGSCVDNATSTALAWCESKETGTPLQLSRLFLYWNARLPFFKSQDCGSTVGLCALGADLWGAPPETVWPYDVTKFAVEPPKAAWDQGKLHWAQSYWVPSLRQILHSVASGWPVVFAFDMYSSFGAMNDAQGWVCPMPTSADSFLDGHCVTIRGYDMTRKLFLCQNSWGQSWGAVAQNLPGCFWMPFDYVCSPMLASGWRTFRKVAN